MSQRAWLILSLLMHHASQETNTYDAQRYLAAWDLTTILQCEMISSGYLIYPQTPEEKALKELVDVGIVEELDDLHLRFRLVITPKS